MSAPAEAKRQGKTGRSRHRARIRLFGIVAVAAALLVAALALLLFDGSDTERYARYRRQAMESYQAGDYDRALSELRKATAIEAGEECLMLMADCYEAQGNWDMALETLRRMDRNDAAVTGRIAALEQRKLQQETGETVLVAGERYAPDTRELTLDGRDLGDGVLQEIRQLYGLGRLSLADNHLRDLKALGELGGLRELDLSGNEISDLSPLGALRDLRSLSLDRDPVEDLSPLYVLSELGSLSLRGVELKDEELLALSRALPRCAIYCDGSRPDSLDICLGGQRFDSTVTQLSLRSAGLRDISCLSLCSQLRWLDLSDNEISDLSPLMDLQQLEQLKVAGNTVSDLRPLLGMTGLRRLDLSRCLVTDCSALSQLTGLIELDLSENELADFSALSKLRELQSLRLEATGIEDEDLEALHSLSKLRSLALDRDPGLGDEAVSALRSALPNCTISHDALVYVVDIAGLSFRTDETSICIQGTELSDLRGLERFDCLETLQLGRNRIESVSLLRNCRSRGSIRVLDLSGNPLTDVSVLPALTALEELDLSYDAIVSYEPLCYMKTLRVLDLTGCPVTEQQLQQLREALPDCEIRT